MRFSNRSPLPVQFVAVPPALGNPQAIQKRPSGLREMLQDEYFNVPVWAWIVMGYLFIRRR